MDGRRQCRAGSRTGSRRSGTGSPPWQATPGSDRTCSGSERGRRTVELHRLKGELLLSRALQYAEAEQCFRQALEVARRQRAKSLELRAATSLGRLWQQQGRTVEGKELVESVYRWFAEGFDTADLRGAQQLITSLSGAA